MKMDGMLIATVFVLTDYNLSEGRNVVAYGLVTFGLAAALSAAQPLHAQVTIHVSKITCEQFILFKVTDPQKFAIWLSGYYHGKRAPSRWSTRKPAEFSDKTKDYCRANLTVPVMQAVDTLIAGKK
jgi:acid stress chaperone HdeB